MENHDEQPLTQPTVATSPKLGKPKLLDQVRQILRANYYSIRTEEDYVEWIRRFLFGRPGFGPGGP